MYLNIDISPLKNQILDMKLDKVLSDILHKAMENAWLIFFVVSLTILIVCIFGNCIGQTLGNCFYHRCCKKKKTSEKVIFEMPQQSYI